MGFLRWDSCGTGKVIASKGMDRMEERIPGPYYGIWTAQDQSVLASLLRNMTREVPGSYLIRLTSSLGM
jgi:hypothetical protein